MENNKWRMLCEECKEINIEKEPDMGQHTSFKAGGRAALLLMPEDQEQLRRILEYLSGEELPYMILGNGSNLLVRDGGYEGAMVKLGEGFRTIEANRETGLLTAGANVSMSQVAQAAIGAGLGGFEPLSGIPGTLGGALFMSKKPWSCPGMVGDPVSYKRKIWAFPTEKAFFRVPEMSLCR
jgi:UDP-N-acetylmuramate dehydrogenase